MTEHEPLSAGAEISAELPPQERGRGIGLALSGGGFRATLFHLGVVAFLRHSGRLSKVSHITSVSGGSILAAHLVLNWEAYTGDEEDFGKAATELLNFVRKDVRGRVYRRAPLHVPFRFVPQPVATIPAGRKLWRKRSLRKSTTDLLIDYYTELYHGETLAHLEGKNRPELYLLTTNQTDGTLCSFTSTGFRDEERKCELQCDIELARAVAASSAFPGLFPPVALNTENSGIPGKDLGHSEILLTDGGVYDNLGLRKFRRLLMGKQIDVEYIVVSDASAEFKLGYRGGLLEPLRTSLRAADILSKRINDLEREMARDEMFKLVDISRIVLKADDSHAMAPVLQRELVSIRTDLDEFSELEIAALVRHGYCVAQARLGRDESDEEATSKFPGWDPLPKSKHSDVISLRESKKGKNEELRKKLDRSAIRRLRLFSRRDRVTYLQASAVILFVLAYLFLPSVYYNFRDLRMNVAIAGENTALKDLYRREILRRAVDLDNTSGFTPGAPRSAKPIETWTTSQAAYALLKSGDLSTLDREQVIKSLETRFVPTPSGDYQSEIGGWIGRPSLPHLQAEPAIWTGAALAVALQAEPYDSPSRPNLEKLLMQIQVYMADHGIYNPSQDSRVGFNVLADQLDKQRHSVYTTSLGLMMLVEIDRAGLKWDNQDPKQLMRPIVQWLNYEYDYEDPPGWLGLTGDESASTSEAVSLQCLSIILEVHQYLDEPPPNKLKVRIREHLQRVANDEPDNSDATATLDTVQNGVTKPAEARINFLWRPWAIKLSRAWLAHVTAHVDGHTEPWEDKERQEILNLLYKLVAQTGRDQFQKDRTRATFRLAEMLIGYSSP